jgi:hypothetical protein
MARHHDRYHHMAAVSLPKTGATRNQPTTHGQAARQTSLLPQHSGDLDPREVRCLRLDEIVQECLPNLTGMIESRLIDEQRKKTPVSTM